MTDVLVRNPRGWASGERKDRKKAKRVVVKSGRIYQFNCTNKVVKKESRRKE